MTDDIARIDAELDRIRWYVSRLIAGPYEPKKIAEALKIGEATFIDLTDGQSQ